MASHYKLYDGMGEVIPFNARYAYPTQANRAWKSLMRVPPKNGNTFSSSDRGTIRFELPAQGYLDTSQTTLTFDLTFNTTAVNARLQNNAQSWITRARWTYGSMVGEDIRDYNIIVRKLTEATGTNTTWTSDQTSVAEGVGGIKMVMGTTTTTPDFRAYNTRAHEIQSANWAGTNQVGGINNGTRRYQVQLALGLFQQNKLVPLKWMASQVAIELELADFADCVATQGVDTTGAYTISNPAMLLQLYEFDGTYDAAFLEGLRGGGVPLKFSSWDTFTYPTNGSSRQTMLIPERNRSLKAAFCVQLPPKKATSDTNNLPWDSHAFMESTNEATPLDLTTKGLGSGNLLNYQWRIGGKYYPSQPVLCSSNGGPNGGAEAYTEFAKALNIVGDYRLSTGINSTRWSRTRGSTGGTTAKNASSCIDWSGNELTNAIDRTNHSVGPSAFVIAADFETSSGNEVSGLNGEEQNDIALMIEYSDTQHLQARYDVFVYYDALLILRENNLVELIK